MAHDDQQLNPRIDFLAVIPARAGSKRLKRKNLLNLGRQPLIAHTIQAARHSSRLSKVVVSTDCPQIAEAARGCGAEVPFMRSAALADDKTPMIDVLRHAVCYFENIGITIGAVVLLQPTSPFRTGAHIDAAINLFEKKNADTITSVCLSKEHPYWAVCKTDDGFLAPLLGWEKMAADRFELPTTYKENGAIYIIRSSTLKSGRFYGDSVAPFVMDSLVSVDIDHEEDLLWAEFLLERGMVTCSG